MRSTWRWPALRPHPAVSPPPGQWGLHYNPLPIDLLLYTSPWTGVLLIRLKLNRRRRSNQVRWSLVVVRVKKNDKILPCFRRNDDHACYSVKNNNQRDSKLHESDTCHRGADVHGRAHCCHLWYLIYSHFSCISLPEKDMQIQEQDTERGNGKSLIFIRGKCGITKYLRLQRKESHGGIVLEDPIAMQHWRGPIAFNNRYEGWDNNRTSQVCVI